MDRTRALRTKDAKEVAKGIFSIYCRQGAPVQIVSDNGTEFTNIISKTLQEVHDCKLIFSAPYYPQTNGLVESAHKAIKRALIKSISEKREDWSHYLEQVTFSLNIRPRETTGYSAFELMHGSRKPRLPNEAENMSFLYPDISLETTSLTNEDDHIEELVQLMNTEQEHSFQLAGEKLLKSKKEMKKQYDKKIHPITKAFQINDEVIIENLSTKRSQGGKLQDKWIGPYPITKVTNSTLQVYKNKTVQRGKRSKAKILKKPHQNSIVNSSSKTIRSELIEENHLAFDEDFLETCSLFLGTEEAVFATEEQNDKPTKAEIMDQLLSMKTQVIESIRTNTPLSPLHEELHKKRDVDYKNLLEWKSQYYPVTNRETSLEISEILSEWYLESYNIQIPSLNFHHIGVN